MGVLISDCFAYAFEGETELYEVIICKLANTFYFVFGHLALAVGVLFIFNKMGYKAPKWVFYVMLIPTVLIVTGDFINLQVGWLFYFNANNEYTRGFLNYLSFVYNWIYAGSCIALMVYKLITSRDKNEIKMLLFIILFSFLPIGGIVLQFNFIWVPFTWPLTSLAIFIIYISYHNQSVRLDYLTKIYTKAVFDKYALKQDYLKNDFCLIILDIDSFKKINDTYGHKEGDMLLRFTAENLKAYFKENSIVGRIGGDEFAVLVYKIKSREKVISSLDAFLCNEHNAMLDIVSIKFTCSAGVCFADGTILSYDELFEKADMALYRRKDSGRDGYTIFRNDENYFKIEKPYVLLIDSSELKRTVISSYLTSQYTIIEAETVDDAKHYLHTYKTRISCVLCDINSKTEADGIFKNIHEVRSRYNIDSIVFSDQDNKKALAKYEVDLYLIKPFNLDLIVEALAKKIDASIKND